MKKPRKPDAGWNQFSPPTPPSEPQKTVEGKLLLTTLLSVPLGDFVKIPDEYVKPSLRICVVNHSDDYVDIRLYEETSGVNGNYKNEMRAYHRKMASYRKLKEAWDKNYERYQKCLEYEKWMTYQRLKEEFGES